MINVNSWTCHFVVIHSKYLLQVFSDRNYLKSFRLNLIFSQFVSPSLPVSTAGPMKTTEDETIRSLANNPGFEHRAVFKIVAD